MKIVSTTCCPVGPSAGHDGDESRAYLLDNGSVACGTCATTYPKMSNKVLAVYRAICSSGFHAPAVELGSRIQPGTGECNAACLSGYDPAQSDRVQATFKRDGLICRLDYEQRNESEIENPSVHSRVRRLSTNERASLPEFIGNTAKALEGLGFSVRHLSEVEMGKRRLLLSCGREVGSMGYVIGLSVELSWSV